MSKRCPKEAMVRVNGEEVFSYVLRGDKNYVGTCIKSFFNDIRFIFSNCGISNIKYTFFKQ